MEYYSIGKFAKKIGKTAQTLRNWDKRGMLKPSYVTEGGTRYYSQVQLNHFLGHNDDMIGKKTIGYCRVGSDKQKDEIERQVDDVRSYMIARGYQFEIIQDVGSGINYSNKGLNSLLDKVFNHEVDKIVILHKDRLIRFGYELTENICKKHGTPIEIIDYTEKTGEQELMGDLAEVVNLMSCRSQGKRIIELKNKIQELTENGMSMSVVSR